MGSMFRQRLYDLEACTPDLDLVELPGPARASPKAAVRSQKININTKIRGTKMKSLERFNKYFQDIAERKNKLMTRKAELEAKHRQLESEFEEAFLNDTGHVKIQAEKDAIQDDIKDVNQKILILERANPNGDTLQEICRAVLDEGKATAQKLKADYIKQAEQVISLRDQYLVELGKLGKIKAEASSLTHKCSGPLGYLPGPREVVHLDVESWRDVEIDPNLAKKIYDQVQY